MNLPPPESPWYYPLLQFTLPFRLGVAVFTVLTGVVALFTDRALQERKEPLKGLGRILGNTPLESKEFTPWGYRFLAVLFIAGLLQFSGDWLKDKESDRVSDERLAKVTTAVDTAALNSEKAIKAEAEKQTGQVVKNVQDNLKPIIETQKTVVAQSESTATLTKGVLRKANDQLYPFKYVGWSWAFVLNDQAPEVKGILSRARKTFGQGVTNFTVPPWPGQITAASDDPSNGQISTILREESGIKVSIVGTDRGEDRILLPSQLSIADDFDTTHRNPPPFSTGLNCFDRAAESRKLVEGDLGTVGGEGKPVDRSSSNALAGEKIDCELDAYPDAPLMDEDAGELSIRYLSDLAGKSLLIESEHPEVLHLKWICLHIENRSLCFDDSQFRPINFLSSRTPGVRFPKDIESIINVLKPGIATRTRIGPNGTSIFSIPQ
jgi:hypothetical protein